MNYRALLFLPFFILISISPGAFATRAATNTQLDSIAELGRLNGVALQCRYTTQMQQIKQALVLNLPKQRALGEWFENKTNDSFMAFMSTNASCPSATEFMQQVNAAIIVLESEFKK
ncbi:MAG: hypothetical protein DRQ44_04740 [Gammaproteobacteria bacterium]|nr:MAG: hypothetical protein DRQ44_04740 [Gammaproteobacteria bacterium]